MSSVRISVGFELWRAESSDAIEKMKPDFVFSFFLSHLDHRTFLFLCVHTKGTSTRTGSFTSTWTLLSTNRGRWDQMEGEFAEKRSIKVPSLDYCTEMDNDDGKRYCMLLFRMHLVSEWGTD